MTVRFKIARPNAPTQLTWSRVSGGICLHRAGKLLIVRSWGGGGAHWMGQVRHDDGREALPIATQFFVRRDLAMAWCAATIGIPAATHHVPLRTP